MLQAAKRCATRPEKHHAQGRRMLHHITGRWTISALSRQQERICPVLCGAGQVKQEAPVSAAALLRPCH